jgi:hypothetical protein
MSVNNNPNKAGGKMKNDMAAKEMAQAIWSDIEPGDQAFRQMVLISIARLIAENTSAEKIMDLVSDIDALPALIDAVIMRKCATKSPARRAS